MEVILLIEDMSNSSRPDSLKMPQIPDIDIFLSSQNHHAKENRMADYITIAKWFLYIVFSSNFANSFAQGGGNSPLFLPRDACIQRNGLAGRVTF